LLENLLILARADSGKEALQFSAVDLSALVRETAEQGQKLAAARRLEFQAQIEDRAVEVLADPHATRRLVLILLDNAVKYTPQPGRVSLSLTAGNASATVQVGDTGIGIAGEELPHIFERFYRTDKARSRETGGVGLGLAIAQWIAEKHKGRITVESELGRGTVFQVSFPLAGAAPEKAV
jgi:signal transduction histidine kinase